MVCVPDLIIKFAWEFNSSNSLLFNTAMELRSLLLVILISHCFRCSNTATRKYFTMFEFAGIANTFSRKSSNEVFHASANVPPWDQISKLSPRNILSNAPAICSRTAWDIVSVSKAFLL